MKGMKQWVKLPTAWIEAGGLKALRWQEGIGSSNVAGLMLLAVIAHHADDEGLASHLTYDVFCAATGLSRTKVASGLTVLYGHGLVEKSETAQSAYRLARYDPAKGWGKLPARGLYRQARIPAFHDMHLRKVTELDALKLYYAVVARRDNATNWARMSYVTIEEFSGIPRNRIRSAISLLAASNLLHVDHLASQDSDYGVSNAYRLAHLETTRHMGTTGRSTIDGLPFEDA